MMQKASHSIQAILVVIALLFAVQGCSAENVQAFKDLGPLRQKLVDKYHENRVSLTVNNFDTLGISFVNTPFNELSRTEKEAKAREIATFAKENYGSMDQFRKIWVSFVVYEKLFFVIDYTNSLDTFFFDKNELGDDEPLIVQPGEFRTEYTFQADEADSIGDFQGLSFLGIGALVIGLGIAAIVVLIVWKTKKKIFYLMGLGSLFFICWGTVWTAATGSISQTRSREYTRLKEVYDTEKYQVAEGIVHVEHEQPRSGHDTGDIIVIGGKQFTISYFSGSPGYHQTIAYGGALSEGTYARIFYDGDTILRVDIKTP